MPTYDFKCENCGHSFERFLSIRDDSEIKCPICGRCSKRLISAGAGLIFKGTGFYVTDYKKKESKNKSDKKAKDS